ncbi:IS630 transposase-related protein [Suttonella ornithocola]|uniref:IS630 transposase-related protein n=1 Tax=Suttonella ornithocola TaxID=279832 RepID=UPI000A043893
MQRWKKNPERKKRVFKLLKIDNELLKADVKAYPDDYQWERAQRFGCSQKSIRRALKRIGMTLKKRR